MEDEILIELLSYAIIGLVSIVSWLVVTVFNMKKEIALNSASDEEMKRHVDLLGAKIDKLTESVTSLREALLVSKIIEK
jgi:hypothetical protein